MADFEAHLENAGTPGDPRFRVFITYGSGGFARYGPKVIQSCASHEDLEKEMQILLLSLDAAYQAARAMLTESARNAASSVSSCAMP